MANHLSDNPAARLYALLREAKRQTPDMSIRDVWMTVFSVEKKNLVEMMRCLIALSDLADRVEGEVLKLDVKHEIFLKHLPTVRRVVGGFNLDAPWKETRNLLAEEVLTSLEFCSERLNAIRPEKALPAEEFGEISKQVSDLFSTIDQADLPEDLRQVLLNVTQMLQDTLTQYRISGVDGLRQELFVVLDRLQRVHNQLNQEKMNPAVQALFKALGYWDTITSVALNTPQLLHAVLALK